MKNKTKNIKTFSFAIVAIALVSFTGCKGTQSTASNTNVVSKPTVSQVATESEQSANKMLLSPDATTEEILATADEAVSNQNAEEKPTIHLHDYKRVEVYENICTGRVDLVCECGAIVKNVSSIREHNYTPWEIVTPATTTENGLKKSTCTKCGNITTDVVYREITMEEMFESMFADLDCGDGICDYSGKTIGDGYDGTCAHYCEFAWVDNDYIIDIDVCYYYSDSGEKVINEYDSESGKLISEKYCNGEKVEYI